MKYIQTYENLNRKYKTGNIVIVLQSNELCIVSYKLKNNKYILYSLEQNDAGLSKKVYELYPKYFRRATSEEIEEWKTMKDIKKYNL